MVKGIRWIGYTALFAALGLALIPAAGPINALQPGDASCPALLDEVMAAVQEACSNVAPGEVCLGSEPVTVTAVDEADVSFSEAGDTAALAEIASLSTGSAGPAESAWGVVLLNLDLGAPESSPPLRLHLFGAAELAPVVQEAAAPDEAVTLTLRNVAGYAVNLRAGAGTTFPEAGTLDEGAEAVADARNEIGDWFRIQTDNGPAWVFSGLVMADGDPFTLAVRAADDLSGGAVRPDPAFTLVSSSEDANLRCGGGSSGLLVEMLNERSARLVLNGVELVFANASALVQAAPDGDLRIMVINGDLTVSALDRTAEASSGAMVTVALGGEDGLTPTAAPEIEDTYSFAAVEGAPLGLQLHPAICIVGLADDAAVSLWSGPGEEYDALASLDTAAHYRVSGQYSTDSGDHWLLVASGSQQAWVPQAAVQSVGLCAQVVEVPPPGAGSTASAGNTGGSASGSGSFMPAVQTVWQANTGLDNVSGTCNNPPIAMCSHLAAVIPNGDGTITWRGQDPAPYPMIPAGTNTFTYEGRNALGNGNVSMSLTFDSPTTWSMTMTTVFDDDPACSHTFYYTATLNW